MSLRNTVGTLAHGAVSTAASAVRHPISTASMAAGLVKGTAEASVDLVRGVVRGQDSTKDQAKDQAKDQVKDEARNLATDPLQDQTDDKIEVPKQRDEIAAEPEVTTPTVTEATAAPREPEVVPKPVPEIDELPEPIVIEADDTPGEAFHTEPKAASRDSEHGGQPGDREEAEGYVEEIPDRITGEITGETPNETLVWTSESSTPAPDGADQTRT